MKHRGSADQRLAAATARGFTLIEVLVALVIVALGMSALLETLSASANNISALREKTVAEWIAMNQIADERLALTVPSIGITAGDVHNCGNANWHWQQQVAAVDAVPGLLSITVSVQRTGPASAKDRGPGSSSSAGSSTATASAAGALGASSPGATGGLGSSSALIGIGCTTTSGPGSSLGTTGTLGAGLGGGNAAGAGATNGPTDSIGPSGGIGPGAATAAATGNANPANPAAAGSAGATGSNSGGSLVALPSAGGGKGQNWLITLTGFRGNSLGAASGESPDWTGSTFAGESGANGIPNGAGAVTTAPPQAGVLTQ